MHRRSNNQKGRNPNDRDSNVRFRDEKRNDNIPFNNQRDFRDVQPFNTPRDFRDVQPFNTPRDFRDVRPFNTPRDFRGVQPFNAQRDLRDVQQPFNAQRGLRDVRRIENDVRVDQPQPNKRPREYTKYELEPEQKKRCTDFRNDRAPNSSISAEKPRNIPQQDVIPQIPVRSNQVRPSTAPACLFQGNFGDNYSNFLADVQKNRPAYRDFRSLGAIDERSDKYYFNESDSVKIHARNFMNGFWSDRENRRATIENHQDKYNVRGRSDQQKPLYPCCISFIDAVIGNKQYCFVAISGATKLTKDVSSRLQHYVDAYNRQQRDCEFVSLQGNVGNFSTLVSELSNHKDGVLYKECSEKYYASCLTKLFYQYGNNIRVTGVVNCSFYPFNKYEVYGNHRDSVDYTIAPPIFNDGVSELDSGYLLTRKPCCQTCQENKDKVLSVMQTAQQKGAQHQKEKAIAKSCNDLITSPLRHSVNQTCSLLGNNSVFQQTQAPGHVVREEKRKVEIKICNK